MWIDSHIIAFHFFFYFCVLISWVFIIVFIILPLYCFPCFSPLKHVKSDFISRPLFFCFDLGFQDKENKLFTSLRIFVLSLVKKRLKLYQSKLLGIIDPESSDKITSVGYKSASVCFQMNQGTGVVSIPVLCYNQAGNCGHRVSIN